MRVRWFVGLMLLLCGRVALAGGPRYVSGPPFFQNAGNAVVWGQSSLLYATDPGALSTSVNHAAADALVQAAASVWNLPQASITVGRGGSLAEHVSGSNVYLGPGGMVYPADVASANHVAVPVAVVYDTDGSVTDTLLGSGASDPLSCRQNAVTETVDLFDPAGYILHAIIVINGRCTGPVAAQQLQVQYQLERVFGRVLGLAWSQTNDNVLMGTPTATYNQALHWPIMHPLDVICSAYTYQCLPEPFTLRADDIAGVVLLYPVQDGATAAGKQGSLVGAEAVFGQVTFPTGQGMVGVNVLARRATLNDAAEGWFESSAVTGSMFRRSGSSPFVTADGSALGSEGTTDQGRMGQYTIGYVPLQAGQQQQDVEVSLEAVNPLYTGAYSVGPYALGAVVPSGTLPAPQTILGAYSDGYIFQQFNVATAAPACGSGVDGSQSAPVAMANTGWWTGLLCGYGHAAYTALAVRPGRSLTVEVTALDENGYATTGKAMPVIGLFGPTDQGNALPSIAAAVTAFDSAEVGTTALTAHTGQMTGLRLGIADQRGDGRPDYAYQARVFYADTVLPVQVAETGGLVTVTGCGFRAGNQARVNGVAAQVVSATANQLVVKLPAMAAAGASEGAALDLVVMDGASGATSTMSGVLRYEMSPGGPGAMKLVSAPAGVVYAGDAVATAFAVEVVRADGVTPVVGEAVDFAASSGAAVFSACGASVCTVLTNAQGVASTGVVPMAAGTLTVAARDGALQQSASLQVLAQDGRMALLSAPAGALAVGVQAATAFSVQVFDAAGHGDGWRLITFSVPVGSATFSGCSSTVCAVTADYSGTATVQVTPTGAGPLTLLASDGDLTQSVSVTAGSSADVMKVLSVPAATSYVGQGTGFFLVQVLKGDGVTPESSQHVIFSAPPQVLLSVCNAAVCDVTTNGGGEAQTLVTSNVAGTYVIQATFGTITQSATVTFTNDVISMAIVSAPAGKQVVGQATSVPFSVQLQFTDGRKVANGLVTLQGTPGGVVLNVCGGWNCSVTTDANGVASTTLIPMQTGALSLNAVFNQQVLVDSFVGVLPMDQVSFVNPPGSGVLVGQTVAFGVQVTLPDGVTPAVGKTVTFLVTRGSLAWAGCAGASCTGVTDASGRATVKGMPLAAGEVAVQASEGGASAVAAFVVAAQPDVLRLVSGPAGNVFTGTTAAAGFSVQALKADGVTASAGTTVQFSVARGYAVFGACGGPSCGVVTDANGLASTSVTAGAAGVVVLQANDAAAAVQDTFTSIALPDRVMLVSVPDARIYVGAGSIAAFAVRVTLADGVTPVAGVAVSFTGGPQVSFSACGLAACTVTTNAAGVASTGVLGVAAGPVTLGAGYGDASVSAAMTVVANQQSVSALGTPFYVAEGASFTGVLMAAAMSNGGPAAGLTLLWSGQAGLMPGAASTVTDADGQGTTAVLAGPLSAGQTAEATACGWGNVCASFSAAGVSVAGMQVQVARGGSQVTAGGAGLLAVEGVVSDGQGHPVAGARVTVDETVSAVEVACPPRGRCPVAPVLESSETVLISGADGRVSVVPLILAGVATETKVLLTVGTAGAATANVVNWP